MEHSGQRDMGMFIMLLVCIVTKMAVEHTGRQSVQSNRRHPAPHAIDNHGVNLLNAPCCTPVACH